MIRLDGQPYVPTGAVRGVSRHVWDFGFIIRGPHPIFENRMLMVLAGRGALGTQAASLAATEPKHIGHLKTMLQDHLPTFNLDDHRQAFWAVVSLARDTDSRTHEAHPESLRIEHADPCRPVHEARAPGM